MVRELQVIKRQMTDSFIADPNIILEYDLTPSRTFEQDFSDVSVENILFDNVAMALWHGEDIQDTHANDLKAFILMMKPHSTRWYAEMGIMFQYGASLNDGSIVYDNSGLTLAQVAAQQLVKYCVATERPGGLNIKIAGLANNDLAPIAQPVLDAFIFYMNRIKDAGVRLWFTNQLADRLKLALTVYYDPLILNDQGQLRTNLTIKPVEIALDNYLKNLPFNGLFLPSAMTDALQLAQGVKVPHILTCETQYGNLPFADVAPDGYIPFAGYLRISPGDLMIQYLPYNND